MLDISILSGVFSTLLYIIYVTAIDQIINMKNNKKIGEI